MVKNRKMKLTAVFNTENGERRIGCRASGIHKGYYIERTATCLESTFDIAKADLETMAIGKYNAEVREIDKMLAS